MTVLCTVLPEYDYYFMMIYDRNHFIILRRNACVNNNQPRLSPLFSSLSLRPCCVVEGHRPRTPADRIFLSSPIVKKQKFFLSPFFLFFGIFV